MGRERRLSGSSPAASPLNTGNSHSAATSLDYGPEPDAAAAVPLILTVARDHCTVTRPHRTARATAHTLSPAARRRRVSPSRAARFSGALVARSCSRFQPARFPPRHNRPSSAGRSSTAAGCHGSRARPAQHPATPGSPGSPGSRASVTIMVKDSIAVGASQRSIPGQLIASKTGAIIAETTLHLDTLRAH